MIETHYHLDKLPPESRDSLLASWFAQGLEAIVAPAMDRDSLDQVLEIAQSAPGKVFPAAGLHPERNWQGEQGKAALRQAEALCRWIEQNRDTIWAIGEIGLPWYSLEGGEAPKAAFQALELFLETARRTDLPLILHAVHDMARPCLERLQAYGVKRAVFHWLKAPDFVAQAIAEAGYYASLTPEYICFERDQRLAGFFSIDRLLLETDGPEGLRMGREGVPSPLWSRMTAAALVRRFGKSPLEIERQMDENARCFLARRLEGQTTGLDR